MASKALNNRKKKEERELGKLARNKHTFLNPVAELEKCPVFPVQYLGKTPAGGEYGREYITEPVATLLRLRDRRPKPLDSALHISDKGFHFLDKNGPFGKEKHVLIPIHHICYGVADEQHSHVFAIITRTDSNSENSLFDCHAFWCDHKKTAQEVTVWLLRTFLEVFNDLQKKRKERQERKLRKLHDAHVSVPMSLSPPNSHKGVNLAMYSVIFEGPTFKGHGAAVRLTRNRPQTIESANPAAYNVSPNATYPSVVNSGIRYHQTQPSHARHSLAQVYERPHPPVTVMPPTDISYTPEDVQSLSHDPRPLRIVPGRSQCLNSEEPYIDINRGAMEYPHLQLPSAMGPINVHLLDPPFSRPRYEKKPGSRSSSHVSPSGSSRSNGSMTRDSNKDGDFIFIDMLQEAFSDIGDSASHVAPAGAGQELDRWFNPQGQGSSSISSGSNPLEKLTSEDIERRIRNWLIEGEEPSNNIPGNNESQYSSTHHGPIFRHSGNGKKPTSYSRDNSTPIHLISGAYGVTADKNYF